jgi:hypothetical protein
MSTTALVWQLGMGLGHMLGLVPFARKLAATDARRVYIVLRRLKQAPALFGSLAVRYLQAPAKTDESRSLTDGGYFVHLLANTGFGDDHELFALACAWRNLFKLIRPDLIVFDHSPIALLASRGLSCSNGIAVRRIVIGNGFTCPPDTVPMPVTRSARYLKVDSARAAEDECRVLARINWVLRGWIQPPLTRLAELYSQVDETYITNFEELDHYLDRPEPAQYLGLTNDSTGGSDPGWPTMREGKRVFAYLKPFPGLQALLESLRHRKLCTLVYPDSIPSTIKKSFESETIRFVDQRPDPVAAAKKCHFALLNATPGTTCDMLLAGKPVLQVPIFGEQQLLAENCERLGVSQTIWPLTDSREQIDQTLDRFLANLDQHTKAAQAFAAKYADFDPQAQREKMLARTLQLLESPGPKRDPPTTDFALHYP